MALVALAMLALLDGWAWAHGTGRCDESCYEGGGWTATMDAWQWDGMFYAPLAGGALVGTAALLVRRGHGRLALGALVLSVPAYAVYAVLVSSLTSFPERFFL